MGATVRSRAAACVLTLAVQSVVVACAAGAEVEYGAGRVGPTTDAGPTTPATASPAPARKEGPSKAREPRPPRTVCGLFSTAAVSDRLGLEVADGALTRRGTERTCTWNAVADPRVPKWRIGDPVLRHDDGIVTVTTAPGKAYRAVRARIERKSHARGGSAQQELDQFGPDAFAMGASVSGVPLWFAVARHEGRVVAVEVSGADSRASIATVIEFLGQTLARL
jgi:hypothetical protein